ncbi:hypothetical protein PIIN_11078 [Serendipita indica DSM 11827]|uniref:Uncharacterized protein n=1 Tax=Serendipita indica (strain DSM 11827) TaxID=1109443 RepID=G4U0K0_SERID|nr:hypothetical protein PIIN_11078 [Serendipita indica DSM 11827]
MPTSTQQLGGLKSKYGLKIITDEAEMNKAWVASYYWQRPTGTDPDAREFAAAAAVAFLGQYGYN